MLPTSEGVRKWGQAAGKVRQQLGIYAVGLQVAPHTLGKVAGTLGGHNHHWQARLLPRVRHAFLITPRTLQQHPLNRLLLQPRRKRLPRSRLVRHFPALLGRVRGKREGVREPHPYFALWECGNCFPTPPDPRISPLEPARR
jgi:hypothetical protein